MESTRVLFTYTRALILGLLLTPIAALAQVEVSLDIGVKHKLAPALVNPQVKDNSDVVAVENGEVVAKKVGEAVIVAGADGARTDVLRVKVLPAPTLTIRKTKPQQEPLSQAIALDGSSKFLWISGEEYEISASRTTGNVPATIEATVTASETLARATPTDAKTNLIAVSPPSNGGKTNVAASPVVVTIALPSGGKYSFKAEVREAPTKLELKLPSEVREGSNLPLIGIVTGAGGGRYEVRHENSPYEVKCSINPDPNSGSAAAPKIEGNRLLVGRLGDSSRSPVPQKYSDVCHAELSGLTSTPTPNHTFTVIGSPGSITFFPPNPTMTDGGSMRVTAQVIRRDGAVDNLPVTWEVKAESKDFVVVNPEGTNSAWINLSPGAIVSGDSVGIKAFALAGDNRAIEGDLMIRVRAPTAFTTLRASMEMLDEQAAHDLYGQRTAKEFYVAKLTLVNDLKNQGKHEFEGASVLVFSNSLAVGVALEKTQETGRSIKKEAQWKKLVWSDAKRFGMRLTAEEDPNAELPTCDDIWQAARPVRRDDPAEQVKAQQEHDDEVAQKRLRQLHYRPYPYDLIVKSYEARDNRSARTWTFRTFALAGALGSFVSAIGDFGASNDLALVTEKFGNLLIPAIGRFWPDLRESQRQNLISDTMHPIEEIPYGSSLTKVVFFPRKPFQGFESKTWYRIAEICPYEFQVQVAVVQKKQQERVQTQNVTTGAVTTGN